MSRKISIVIPTYRRPKLLVKCIDALLNQEDFSPLDYEIIIVSDGPDELTEEVLESVVTSAEPRIIFMNLPEKKGPAAARNFGWLNASGSLVAFTDDDCIPDKNWLSAIWRSYDGLEDVAFSGKVIVPLSKKPTDFELNTAHLETAEFITANCICSKTALIKTGGFDERFALAWREDSDLHFKLLLNNIPIHKINAVVVHPVRQAPWGVSLKEQKKGMFNALLYKKYPSLYKERIGSKAPLKYYLMIVSFTGIVAGAILSVKLLVLISFVMWVALQYEFISKRLASTSRAIKHVIEMIITSIAIPFLSVFWQLYGALKYRVLFV
ncbi:MAG TPA: glycosyltransferase [Pedobacter sp.]|jgi:glycosyltransferase involved in cell wall biosynthesis